MNNSTSAVIVLPEVVPRRYLLAIEYFGIGIIPVLSLALINKKYDIWVLSSTFGLGFLLVFWRVYVSRVWSWHELGFRLDNLWKRDVTPWYILCAIVGCITIFYCRDTSITNHDPSYESYVKYSVIGSAMQEFLYRVYLLKLGEELFGSKSSINYISNILLFTGMHWFFPNIELVLVLVFAGGVLFTFLYAKQDRRNFFLIFLVHVLFNATAIKAAIFKEKEKTRIHLVFFVYIDFFHQKSRMLKKHIMEKILYIIIPVLVCAIGGLIWCFLHIKKLKEENHSLAHQANQSDWNTVKNEITRLDWSNIYEYWKKLNRYEEVQPSTYAEEASKTMLTLFNEKRTTWQQFGTYLIEYKNFQKSKEIEEDGKKIGEKIFLYVADQKDYKVKELAEKHITAILKLEETEKKQALSQLGNMCTKEKESDIEPPIKSFYQTYQYIGEQLKLHLKKENAISREKPVPTQASERPIV
jgi:membrane protease YdiL (CAAX protease family)